MGNKASKPQSQETITEKSSSDEITKFLMTAMKSLAGEKIAYKVVEFIHKPELALPNTIPKFKKWKTTILSALGSLAAGSTCSAGTFLHHVLRPELVALVGHSALGWASILSYVSIVANIVAIGVQIYYICKTSKLLTDNNKYLGKVNDKIRKLKTEVSEILTKCNDKQWKELAEPQNMKKIDDMMQKIVDTQAELNRKIHELQITSNWMKTLAGSAGGLAVLSIIGVGFAAGFALLPTGIGGFILLGAVIACAVASGVTAGVSYYYAKKCDEQLLNFRKAKKKLDVLKATLISIKKTIELNGMKEPDVRQWLLDRGLASFGDEESKKILDALKAEKYLIVDCIISFEKEKFLEDMKKYQYNNNVQDTLANYFKDFKNKINAGNRLLGNLTKDITQLDDYKEVLTDWGFEEYISVFKREGYNMIDTWEELDFEELTVVIKMKRGHAKKFLRRTKKYLEKYSRKEEN